MYFSDNFLYSMVSNIEFVYNIHIFVHRFSFFSNGHFHQTKIIIFSISQFQFQTVKNGFDFRKGTIIAQIKEQTVPYFILLDTLCFEYSKEYQMSWGLSFSQFRRMRHKSTSLTIKTKKNVYNMKPHHELTHQNATNFFYLEFHRQQNKRKRNLSNKQCDRRFFFLQNNKM